MEHFLYIQYITQNCVSLTRTLEKERSIGCAQTRLEYSEKVARKVTFFHHLSWLITQKFKVQNSKCHPENSKSRLANLLSPDL